MSVPAKDWSHLSDAQLALALFECDSSGGTLHWRVQKSNRIKAGDRAGRLKSNGYREVRFRGRQIAEHRLIWLCVHGRWPEHQLDHIDGNRSNNSIGNLRDVPAAANMQNIRKPRASRFVGVSTRANGKWQASIGVNGRVVYLGVHGSEEEAHRAYLTAKAELHPLAPAVGV